MQHPFQCIATVQPPTEHATTFLLAACGPKLSAVRLSTGEIVSEWSAVDVANAGSGPPATDDHDDRPAKKQKISSTAAKDIIKLAVAPNHQYLLAVTEDKNVRVFSISNTGHLSELSARCMPKRPCAILILPDNSTILCGDKFGDVYSLPLFPDPNWQPTIDDANDHAPTQFKPSATNKTVHTQRNLKTLEMQQNQKLEAAKPKDSLNFEHQLLLGHVSMLTDLTYMTLTEDGKLKNYVVTADRDEHIRFSRRPPQSYIIEGYCLGHTEFVSKLCPIPNSQLLVSGGGDDWIGLWHWSEFRLRRKINVSNIFDQPSAVSLLKILEADGTNYLLIACERSSNIGIMPVESLTKDNSDVDTWSVVHFEFAVLDITCRDNLALVSFDARAHGEQRLGAYTLTAATPSGWTLESLPLVNIGLEKMNATKYENVEETDLDGAFYGIEKLRKRGYQEYVFDEE